MRDMYVPGEGLRRETPSRTSTNLFVVILSAALRPFVWILKGVRLVAFSAFLVLEPFVSLVLWGLSVLMIFSALILRAVGPPDFPFWGMLGFGLGCATLLVVYYIVMRWLTPR